MNSERLNRYTCKRCGKSITTVDRDEGVTPFMLICRATTGCSGIMQSACYQGVTGTPTFEWRKATPKEYLGASSDMKQHFDLGGLDLHPIVEALGEKR